MNRCQVRDVPLLRTRDRGETATCLAPPTAAIKACDRDAQMRHTLRFYIPLEWVLWVTATERAAGAFSHRRNYVIIGPRLCSRHRIVCTRLCAPAVLGRGSVFRAQQ